jgi:hypothetical protein
MTPGVVCTVWRCAASINVLIWSSDVPSCRSDFNIPTLKTMDKGHTSLFQTLTLPTALTPCAAMLALLSFPILLPFSGGPSGCQQLLKMPLQLNMWFLLLLATQSNFISLNLAKPLRVDNFVVNTILVVNKVCRLDLKTKYLSIHWHCAKEHRPQTGLQQNGYLLKKM